MGVGGGGGVFVGLERERVIALACAHARMCLEQRKSLHVSLCVCLKKKDIIGEIDGVCHNESNN